jgi:transposase, IS5 family
MMRWRQRIGEERLAALLQESLSALKPFELSAVVVDTAVQHKNVAHRTHDRLLNRAKEWLVRLAKSATLPLRQS